MKNAPAGFCFFFFGLLFVGVKSLDPSQCIAPLGMENGLIKDADITASSSFDHGNVGAKHGRIRSELNGGAWCPQSQATSEAKEWIEINLHSVHMITATEVQGRFGNGQGVEFTESYVLEYFRPRLNKWIRYRSRSNSDLLKGNINTYLEEKTVLDMPIWASKIRFHPYSSYKRTVCLRVEVYGCKWSDGVVSYSMPQGDKKGTNWELYDFAYDGQWDGEKLKYGLGQLVDYQTAPEDFKQPFYEKNTQGWIGWKNDTRENKPIEITFEFDKIREFSAVHIFVNNQFTREVQVFRMAKVFFSVGGKIYKGEPITYDYVEDRIFESPRNATIKLHHRVGRYVKIQLFFAARWILISEITFDSFQASGIFSEEKEEEEIRNKFINKRIQGGHNSVSSDNDEKKALDTTASRPNGLGQYLGIVMGVLVLMVVFMLAIVSYVMFQQKKYKDCSRSGQIPDKAAFYRTPSFGHLATTSEYADIKDPDYAVPLQLPLQPSKRPNVQNPFMPPPSPPPSFEHYYAATEICKPQFTPPPPPLCTPPPVRLQKHPRYVANRAYVGSSVAP